MTHYPSTTQSNQLNPVLFVHGAWHGAWCWEEHFVSAFNAAGYDCYTFDLPMHDLPGRVKGINQLSLGDYVNDLRTKVVEIGQQPIIIGHSMGGIILQKYLEQYTCAKAVLLAPAPPHGVIRTTLTFLTKPYAWLPLVSMNLYGLVNTPQKARWAFFSDHLSDVLVQKYTDKMCSESYLAFLKMLMPSVQVNNHKDTPMLVVAGEHDRIFSIRDNERTAAEYGAELVVIKDIGHDMMLDVGWENVVETILGWLKQ